MNLTRRVSELTPRRRRRAERLALASAVFCAALTVPLVAMSVATMRLWWGRSTGQVALSAVLAVAGFLACGVAVANAKRTLAAPSLAEDVPSYGAISIVRGESTGRH